ADALEVRDLALARDERDRTRVLTTRNLGLQHLGDTRQPLRGESDVFGLRRRERIGPDEGREGETDERGNEGREPGHGRASLGRAENVVRERQGRNPNPSTSRGRADV